MTPREAELRRVAEIRATFPGEHNRLIRIRAISSGKTAQQVREELRTPSRV